MDGPSIGRRLTNRQIIHHARDCVASLTASPALFLLAMTCRGSSAPWSTPCRRCGQPCSCWPCFQFMTQFRPASCA